MKSSNCWEQVGEWILTKGPTSFRFWTNRENSNRILGTKQVLRVPSRQVFRNNRSINLNSMGVINESENRNCLTGTKSRRFDKTPKNKREGGTPNQLKSRFTCLSEKQICGDTEPETCNANMHVWQHRKFDTEFSRMSKRGGGHPPWQTSNNFDCLRKIDTNSVKK